MFLSVYSLLLNTFKGLAQGEKWSGNGYFFFIKAWANLLNSCLLLILNFIIIFCLCEKTVL